MFINSWPQNEQTREISDFLTSSYYFNISEQIIFKEWQNYMYIFYI